MPLPVRAARQIWQQRMDEQPMDFFVRQHEDAWLTARRVLAQFVQAPADDLVFVENATAGMGVVANSVRLRPGDQVLLTDHEYGAVQRIWDRACRLAGAERIVVRLPQPVESSEELVSAIMQAVTDRTRLLVVSHITSPTALILPIRAICHAAATRGVPVCVDGPHRRCMLTSTSRRSHAHFTQPAAISGSALPFWLRVPLLRPRWQGDIEPTNLSWGRLLPAIPKRWDEQFVWSGTRDSRHYFAVPAAIEFFRTLGIDRVRDTIYDLAMYARQALVDTFRTTPLAPPTPQWYGAMAHVPLPDGDAESLQRQLWERHRIEVPIVAWEGRRFVRVSCHLYNTKSQVNSLIDALRTMV